MAAAVLLPSCKKNARSYGSIRLSFNGIEASIDDATKSHAGDFVTLPQWEQMNLTIKDADKKIIYSGKASDLDQSESYLTGDYTAVAEAGQEGEEGPAAAFFKGETSFTVKTKETTEVELTAYLANTLVKIQITDNFKKYYSDAAFELATGSGNKFTVTDGSYFFIEPFRFGVKGSMTTPQGNSASFEKWFEDDINPKTCYTVKVDASNISSNTISITFNNEIQTVDLGEIIIND